MYFHQFFSISLPSVSTIFIISGLGDPNVFLKTVFKFIGADHQSKAVSHNFTVLESIVDQIFI